MMHVQSCCASTMARSAPRGCASPSPLLAAVQAVVASAAGAGRLVPTSVGWRPAPATTGARRRREGHEQVDGDGERQEKVISMGKKLEEGGHGSVKGRGGEEWRGRAAGEARS
jgi:hypothetical protein